MGGTFAFLPGKIDEQQGANHNRDYDLRPYAAPDK